MPRGILQAFALCLPLLWLQLRLGLRLLYTDRISELQESNLMRCCVAVVCGGEFVAHLAVRVERPDSLVRRAGRTVTPLVLEGVMKLSERRQPPSQ